MANPVLRVDERVALLKKAITANYAKGTEGVKPVLDAVEQVRQAGKGAEEMREVSYKSAAGA